MKTLYLLRHADAAAGSPSGQDHDRPLSAKGEAQAEKVAAYMLENGMFPQLILASDARRTDQTATAVIEAFGIGEALVFPPELYLAPADILLKEITKTDDTFKSLLVVAHNPGIAELAFQLSGNDASVMAFHPATLAVFNCEMQSWGEIAFAPKTLAKLLEV